MGYNQICLDHGFKEIRNFKSFDKNDLEDVNDRLEDCDIPESLVLFGAGVAASQIIFSFMNAIEEALFDLDSLTTAAVDYAKRERFSVDRLRSMKENFDGLKKEAPHKKNTGGHATDLKVRWPACEKYEEKGKP